MSRDAPSFSPRSIRARRDTSRSRVAAREAIASTADRVARPGGAVARPPHVAGERANSSRRLRNRRRREKSARRRSRLPPRARRDRACAWSRRSARRLPSLLVVDARLGLTAAPVDRLSEITELERQWMPIVQTTLEMNYPALHQELIGNYQRVTAPVLLPLVQEVLARIEGLELSPDPERQQARRSCGAAPDLRRAERIARIFVDVPAHATQR